MPENILHAYGLSPENCTVKALGDGLINHTWKVTCAGRQYILQQVNQKVFKAPLDIAYNLDLLKHYLDKVAPGYLWAPPLPALSGDSFVQSADGAFFRLFVFVPGSHAINAVTQQAQAYEAARQFGQFTRLLHGFDVDSLRYTLTDFHHLTLRCQQLKEACTTASSGRRELAAEVLATIHSYGYIADTYDKLVRKQLLPLRVIHHDTKISNVLFNEADKGLCVIDLDTVMPGYFISDVGDMFRTYLSPSNEEEVDLEKVVVRKEFLNAIHDGYMGQMGEVLTETEKEYFFFAGEFMIYMQAVRFLTDFLNNDIYYPTGYPLHNLMRTKNQLRLLKEYIQVISRK